AAFGSYGLCAAHEGALDTPTFDSAWVTTPQPAALMAAVLQHGAVTYPQRLMVAEARRMGIEILPVAVNASTTDMRLEWVSKSPDTPQGKWGIRLAFTTVLGLTKHEMR